MRLLLGRFAGIDKRASKRKKAVIIKGNPYYLEQGPDTAGYSAYYKAIEDELRSAGYDDVVYDRGDPMTLPPPADLWVGHSRGASRLRFAPKGTKTLNITEYEDGINEYKAELLREMRKRGYSSVREFPVEDRPRPGREHFTLTQRGRDALRKQASVGRDLLIEADKDAHWYVKEAAKRRDSVTLAERHRVGRKMQSDIMYEGKRAGKVFIRDVDDWKRSPVKKPHSSISIFLNSDKRGKRIGREGYRLATEQSDKDEIYAYMAKKNKASIRAAEHAGFVRVHPESRQYVMKWERSRRPALQKQASAPRDYKREYRLFHSSPEAKRNRAKRNLWNRRLKGKVPAGHEIDHKRQLRDGGGNGRDNIRFLPISKNRAEHNRGNVVRDHMRKESSALKGAIIGGGLGGMIGGLDSPDGMRLGNAVKGAVFGGALGGGIGAMHRMMSPATFNLSKEQMAKLPKNFSGDMFVRDGDKIRHLYMNSSGKVTVKGYAPEMASKFGKSDLLVNTTKTASFDPHQWVYDSLIKQAQAVATKRDPAKWEAAKREAKAKMGGKHSARAMQLATQIYKKKGGTYSGKKPSPSNNKLKKWTKQDWQWSKGDRGVYLPKRSASALNSSKAGRGKLLNAERAKRQATAQGVQFSRHGLHTGKKRSDVS
jgi:RimJ/RimL family protein N-acetyltransferase